MTDESHDQKAAAVAVEPFVIPVVTASGVGTPGGPATGTVTPATSGLPPDQVEFSLKVSLADLSAKATALYVQKKYDDAAEMYARAAEMQAEMNGEMSPENADILFLYGRCLFKVGQSKSDVLGGKAPAKKNKPKPDSAGPSKKEEDTSSAQRIAEEGVAIAAAATSTSKEEAASREAKKPLFQFTGDENWDGSDEEEDADGEAEGEAEEEEDDLAVAFEILDLARVLLTKQLEQADVAVASDKGTEESDGDLLQVKHVKERLADTHDLLAEISLENERYPNAIIDARTSLNYKKELYPKESEIVAEAHYKLSLALEFASVTRTKDDDGATADEQQFDEGLRDEAANELEAAIESTQLKLQNKEVELATMHSPDDNEVTRKQIGEVKDIITDMEQRLVELRKPPIDITAALNGPAANAMGGILGAALGETPDQTQKRIAEAKKAATDLTGLVRKKVKDEPKPAAAAPAATETAATDSQSTNGKRKAEDPAAGDSEEEAKKARVDDDAVEA